MKKLVIKAPAKINFGLKVVGKRKDGYHNIETVFYPVSIYDIITITPSESFSFECMNNPSLNEGNNSVLKAIALLEGYIKNKLGIRVELEKNIPIGAGMGGGSSDGATTLVALNEFFDLKLDKEKLLGLALEIGSDAPFFIKPLPSFASSRGEKLTPLNFEIPYPILIVNPGIHISTKWAYGKIKPAGSSIDMIKLLNSEKIDFSILKNQIKNDFEEVVFSEFDEIKKIKEELYKSGASFALMTGSGSTVFGIFENYDTAERVRSILPQKYFKFIHQNY